MKKIEFKPSKHLLENEDLLQELKRDRGTYDTARAIVFTYWSNKTTLIHDNFYHNISTREFQRANKTIKEMQKKWGFI